MTKKDPGKSGADASAEEIHHLWQEVYRAWEKSHNVNDVSEHNCIKTIDIFKKLLGLIDKEKDPHDYCVALRMRAQNYCLMNKFDHALKDLYAERDINSRRNDQLRIKKCEELISQISDWRSDISKISFDVYR